MGKITDLELQQIETFHSDNLFLPTRTIYFGGVGVDAETDSDEVNCRTVAQVIKNLHILDNKSHSEITLLLNSPGGYWDDGIAVYDVIKNLKSKVIIIGMGKLYSMGSVIFQAGNTRLMYPNTRMMVHDGSDGYIGDAKSYENWAKDSKRVRETMYKIYYDHMKKKNKELKISDVEKLCEHDTILTSKECLKLGLTDGVL